METGRTVILLDTDVLIEVERGRQKGLDWLQTVDGEIALPAVVALELLFGARNGVELDRTIRFLADFDVEELDAHDSSLVRKLVADHVLSSGLGLPDFMIAAQALNRQATLFTFNLKHYRAIPGLDAREPYQR